MLGEHESLTHTSSPPASAFTSSGRRRRRCSVQAGPREGHPEMPATGTLRTYTRTHAPCAHQGEYRSHPAYRHQERHPPYSMRTQVAVGSLQAWPHCLHGHRRLTHTHCLPPPFPLPLPPLSLSSPLSSPALNPSPSHPLTCSHDAMHAYACTCAGPPQAALHHGDACCGSPVQPSQVES